MQKLHDYLSSQVKWYDSWHNHPRHKVYHWLAFLAVAGTLAILLALNIGTVHLDFAQVYGQNGGALLAPAQKVAKGGIVGEAEDHILVKFKKAVSASAQAKVLSRHNLKEKSEIKAIGVKLLSIPNGDTPQEVVDRLRFQEKGNIEFAEVDAIVAPSLIPNDPWWPNQWPHPKISDPAAWDITTGASTVIVAIGDTGVDCNHEDLAGKCLPGWNTYDNNSDTSDVYGHGTRVAGTAVANTNNAIGIAAVCWNCKILPIRVSNAQGTATYSSLASAITYAADHGAKAINESYGGNESATVQSAARYMQSKGGVVTMSAGNDSTFISTPDVPEILTIGATDSNDALYSWSNYGNIIDLVAPGCVYTPVRGGGYSGGCGTSFSAPIVAGVAALIYSAKPSLPASQVQDILKQSADDLGAAGKDTTFGWGRVNAYKAVLLAIGATSTPDTQAPTAPANLTAFASESTKVNLSWTASTDNVGVIGYRVYRDSVQIGTSPSNSYIDTTVSANTTYSYTVKAYDAAGNISPSSNTATVTTPALVVAITSYSVTAKTATTATIVWTTSLASTGLVSYGTTASKLNLSATDGIVSTTHSVTLINLTKSTKYYYKIIATSQDGLSTASSPISNFRTKSR